MEEETGNGASRWAPGQSLTVDYGRELYKLQKQFQPAFEQYIEVYQDWLEKDREINPQDRKLLEEDLKRLKRVLFDLKHGAI